MYALKTELLRVFFKYLQFESALFPLLRKKYKLSFVGIFMYFMIWPILNIERNGFMVKILSKILQIIKLINDPTLETEIRMNSWINLYQSRATLSKQMRVLICCSSQMLLSCWIHQTYAEMRFPFKSTSHSYRFCLKRKVQVWSGSLCKNWNI